VPKHIWSTIANPAQALNSKPVGTGPFTEVTDFSPSVYTLCRNPNYWQQDKPYVDCVRYPAYSYGTLANALIKGELDWAGSFIPDLTRTFVAKDPEHFGYYFWPTGAPPVLLYFNTSKAPFNDVLFRRALSNAIDREAVIKNAYGPGYTLAYNPTGLASDRFRDWISQEALDTAQKLGVGGYDVKAARKALQDAGYQLGSNGKFLGKDGRPLSIKIQTVNGWADWMSATQVIAQNFQTLGLDVSVEMPEFSAWMNALQKGTFDMAISWAVYNRTPWDFYYNQFFSGLLYNGTASGTVWHRLTSPTIDKLLVDFTNTIDNAKQVEIAKQLEMFYVTNVPSVPLMASGQWYEWNSRRFVGFPTEKDYYAQGSPWNQPGALITGLRIHCKDATSCGQ
jgi:peptide/nickel transport system substrate-binding protein